MNLLVTLDRNYLPPLRVLLASLLHSNPDDSFDLYIAHHELAEQDFAVLARGLDGARLHLFPIAVPDEELAGAPVEKRYPREMYYRLFACRYLPKTLDRILYLDPDIVALNSMRMLYNIDLYGAWFAAASHVRAPLQRFNELRLDLPVGGAYVNSGVLLMDLEALRRNQDVEQVLTFIRENRVKMMLPDQDVLNALYGDRILPINPLIYNLSEKYYTRYNLDLKNQPVDLDWVRHNTVFVHYCGRNKPWRPGYFGVLDLFYQEYADGSEAK